MALEASRRGARDGAAAQVAELSNLVSSVTQLARGQYPEESHRSVRLDEVTSVTLEAARRDWPHTEFRASLDGCTVDGSAERLAVELDLDSVPLAEVFGRVEDEPFERGYEAGDDVRQAARAVGDVAGAFEDCDRKVGRGTPRLHRRGESCGDAADDQQLISAQSPPSASEVCESRRSLTKTRGEGKSARRLRRTQGGILFRHGLFNLE